MKRLKFRLLNILALYIICLSSNCIFSQGSNGDNVVIKTTKITDKLFMLEGINGFGGGNITASVGSDGILLVDSMYDRMNVRIKKSLDSIAEKPIRIVVNSHFHSDHIEGNKSLKKSAIIIGHQNIKKRLKTSKDKAKLKMIPTITFSDSLKIEFNGEDVEIYHFPNSHSDSDAVVYFTKSKVLHMGDMFFYEMFPAVYTQSGGNIYNLISSLEAIVKKIPHGTKIIPGHGSLATKDDLSNYLDMLKKTTNIVQKGINQGKSFEQLKLEKPFKDYDELGNGGAQTTDEYLAMIYELLLDHE